MMISTPLRSKILSHTRSSSLNARSHPLIPQFNEHLHRLKAGDSTTTPSSLASITKKLTNLEDLHNCVDDLLLLPCTIQVFARECGEKWVEEILDGCLGLVDASAMAKDFIFQSKEHVLNLLSVLRRKRDSDDLSEFLKSRKITKKKIQKSLRNINGVKNSKPFSMALEKDPETIAIISMLKEAESITLDLIEALLISIAGINKGHCYYRPKGWSLISRLMKRKIFGQIEFEEMDANLCRLVSLRLSKRDMSFAQTDELLQQLRDMDARIEVVEETMERLYKRLIKTRVSLLNMMSQ